MYWWTQPSTLVAFLILPIYVLCGLLPQDAFLFYGHADKYLVDEVFWMGLLGLMAFIMGSLLGEAGNPKAYSINVRAEDLKAIIFTVGGIVLGAYVIFLSPLLGRPDLLIAHIHGSAMVQFLLRENLNSIPGVTSLMALQSLVLLMIIYYERLTGTIRPTGFKYVLAAIVLFCLLRAWLWSERLALIELALPFVMASLSGKPRLGKWGTFLPLIGLIGLYLFFSLGEYFRSWQWQQNYGTTGFFEYTWRLFAGYYATALNNGAGMVSFHEPIFSPVFTSHWFHKFPLWNLIDYHTDGEAMLDISSFLIVYGVPHLNNPSGIFMPYVDFGGIIGTLTWLVLGVFSGRVFRHWALGTPLGMLLYPLWFVGVLEILRGFYWGNSRFFPVLFGVAVLIYMFKRNSRAVGAFSQACGPRYQSER